MDSMVELYSSGVIIKDNYLSENPNASNETLVYKGPDEEIVNLYNELIHKPASIVSFDFKMRVVQACLRLTGGLRYFLKYQIVNNRFLYSTNLDFILDTLHFIKTGRRKVDLVIWDSILEEFPKIGDYKQIRNYTEEVEYLNHLANEPDYTIVSRWAGRDNGVADMLRTLYLMFGKGSVLTEKLASSK